RAGWKVVVRKGLRAGARRRIGDAYHEPPEVRIVGRRRVPLGGDVRVVGRVERSVAASREHARGADHTVVERCASRRGVAPCELPAPFVRVGVDDPPVVELAVLARLADGVDVDRGRTVKTEADLLVLLAGGAAKRDERVRGRVAAEAIDLVGAEVL